jgi:sugar/nucleoside kinase (ribokinase family)
MVTSAPGLLVVGNVNVDVKTSPLPPDPRLFTDGETSAEAIFETIGGGGANTAVAAAAMGGAVTLGAAIGADSVGERLRAYLKTHGVRPALAIKEAPTGRSLALNWAGHQRHFVSCLPSAAHLERDDVDLEACLAAGCRHLYRADVWFAPRMLAEGNLDLLREARRLGMTTSLDLNWDPHWHAGRHDALVRERLAAVARLLPEVDFAHGNRRELGFFTACAGIEEAAAWCLDHGARHVVGHLGGEGSALFAPGAEAVYCPARRVARIVSEAATGDVFTAAFLLAEGMGTAERLEAASEAAARHLAGEAMFLPRL